MFQQVGEIEPIITDRDTAAVNDTMDAEGKAILLSKRVVVLNEKPEETASYISQSDQGQPNSLHLGLTLGNRFIIAILHPTSAGLDLRFKLICILCYNI